MNPVKEAIKRLLRTFDVAVIRHSELERLRAVTRGPSDISLLHALPSEHASALLECLRESRSQLRQDLFVLSELNFRRGGYFVEFGATDGIELSNTYLLEKAFGWTGILAEPATCWHAALARNRRARIEHSCVWKDSTSTVTFHEAEAAELSTVAAFSGGDFNRPARARGRTYDVRTISLLDLLRKHDAPREIDYLSIDTEGSEFDILDAFDFDAYAIKVITCEHNFTPARERIFELLTRHGYVRKLQAVSYVDDWYVLAR